MEYFSLCAVRGLILNLMPCVLPVLAMKLGSILHIEKRDTGAIRKQFSVSVVGILVSFWALALFMTVLRYSQEAIGWGIQFQSPWFIGFMVLITAIFTANLFGLFELRLSSNMNTKIATAGGQGYSRHFWEGLLLHCLPHRVQPHSWGLRLLMH